MKFDLELEIKNVYGGDGVTRIKEVESVKLERRKTKTTTKQNIGIADPLITDEKQVEIKQVEVNTFDMQDGKPIIRLGGVHGKLWGSMKQAGHLLCEFEGKAFSSKTAINNLMTMVNIEPVYTPLENGEPMQEVKLPQILNTMGNSMVESHFDVIPKCTAKVSIEFPDSRKEKILRMLEQVQKMACLNKRRSQIKILNWDQINNGG